MLIGAATFSLLIADLRFKVLLWIVIVLSVFLVPRVHKLIKELLPERLRLRYELVDIMMSKVTLTTRSYCQLTAIYLLEWLAMGWVFVMVVALVIGKIPPHADIFVYLGVNSIAMIAGFLAVFAPGGIGVREGVIVALVSPQLGLETTLMISVTMRLVTVIADFIAGAIAMILKAERH